MVISVFTHIFRTYNNLKCQCNEKIVDPIFNATFSDQLSQVFRKMQIMCHCRNLVTNNHIHKMVNIQQFGIYISKFLLFGCKIDSFVKNIKIFVISSHCIVIQIAFYALHHMSFHQRQPRSTVFVFFIDMTCAFYSIIMHVTLIKNKHRIPGLPMIKQEKNNDCLLFLNVRHLLLNDLYDTSMV